MDFYKKEQEGPKSEKVDINVQRQRRLDALEQRLAAKRRHEEE